MKKELPHNGRTAFARVALPISPPFPAMEARAVTEVPTEEGWYYEPKWDGFRCLAYRSGDVIELQSKSGQPLTRYFPEIVDALRGVKAPKFVLDGEIVIEVDGRLDFNALLQRIHPAATRVERLSRETPAMLLGFDLLVDARGKALIDDALRERRAALEEFFRKYVPPGLKKSVGLSPASPDYQQAMRWIRELAEYGCDGIVAKLVEEPYHSGDREGMVKIKRIRTADCVVGGFRYAQKKESGVGSLLLGLYDEFGDLNHVGFTSSFSTEQKLELVKVVKPLISAPGFTGKAPGGPSRWSRSNERSAEWEPLKPKLVCEVQYDHFTNGRFRHGTKFLRWRPDKAPRSCTYDQLTDKKRAA